MSDPHGELDPHLPMSIEELTELIAQQPDEPKLYHQRGLLRARHEQYQQALEDFEQALVRQPSAVRHYQAGVMLARLDRHAEAIKQFDVVLERDADFYQARAERGMAYGRLEYFDQSMLDLRLVILDHPTYFLAWVYRANVHAQRGWWSEVLNDAGRAVRLAPAYAPAYKLMGIAHRVSGNAARSMDYFRKYLEMVPDDPDRGQIERTMGDLEEITQRQEARRGWLDRLRGK